MVATMTGRLCAAILAAAITLGALPAVWAVSAKASDELDPPIWEDNGTLMDETAISEGLGVPIESVRATQTILDKNRAIQEDLSATHPDQFGGMYVDYAQRKVTILWVGDRSALGELSLGDGVLVKDAEYTEERLIATQDAVNDSLTSAGLLADTWTDIRSGRVVVEVKATNAALAHSLTLGISGEGVAPQAVEVREVEQLAQEARSIYAGISTTTCTSGFSVRRTTDGARRGTVAAHCSNTQTFGGATSTFFNSWYSGSRDFQLHSFSTAHVVTPQLYDGSGLRWVTASESRAATTVGEAVCKYGKTTGYDCATVSSKTHRPQYVPSATSTYIRVDRVGSDPFIDGGDSGGPWFHVGKAYGWTSGAALDRSYAIYMSVSYIPSPWVLLLH